MKVLISDNISIKCIDILKNGGLEVDVKTGMSPTELKECIGKYHGLIIRSATKMTADIIEAAKNLKVIGRAGSGLDNVNRTAATKKGIVVMNTPGGNTITTAEHTIALEVSLARQIPQATMSMKAGKWEKKKFMGVELFNKTLGVVGIGNIGGHKFAEGLHGPVVHEKFAELKLASAERCPKALGSRIKRSEIIFHHEVTNQYLWSLF